MAEKFKYTKDSKIKDVFNAYQNQLFIKVTMNGISDSSSIRICRVSEYTSDETENYNMFYWLFIRGNYKSDVVRVVPTGNKWLFTFWDKDYLVPFVSELTDDNIETFAKIHTDLLKALTKSYEMNEILYRRLNYVNPQNMLVKKDKQLYDKYSKVQLDSEHSLSKSIFTKTMKKIKDFRISSLRRFF